jgi:hypothetical protein
MTSTIIPTSWLYRVLFAYLVFVRIPSLFLVHLRFISFTLLRSQLALSPLAKSHSNLFHRGTRSLTHSCIPHLSFMSPHISERSSSGSIMADQLTSRLSSREPSHFDLSHDISLVSAHTTPSHVDS